MTDDSELAESCERILRGAGHRVQAARHSGHAHLLCLSGAPIDVLLVELSMSDCSGPALARRMRRHNPEMKCLYLARAGSRCGTSDVLVRPFTADDLLGRLVRPLETRPKA